MSDQVVTLDSGKRTFEIGSQRWEYDIVEIKLKCEMLEAKHNLKKDGKLLPPTIEFLTEFCSQLFEGCEVSHAYRIYHVVNQQFQELHNSLVVQVNAISI